MIAQAHVANLEDTTHYQELITRYPKLQLHVDEACCTLLREAKLIDIPEDTFMFHEADSCQNFMWLLDGVVRIYKHSEEGREITLYRVSPGELCLLSLNNLLGGHCYPASAKTETPIRGLMIMADQFHQAINDSSGFRTYVLQSLTERMTNMITLISDTTFQRLDLRLACFLGQQFERSSGQSLKITHSEIAHELGTSREVISRILKEFERQDCISLNRGEIQLVSDAALMWIKQDRNS